MPGFIVRPGGSREYLPNEYRGTPQDYYASRIREARRNGKSSSQMKRDEIPGLERDRLMNSEVARLRARLGRSSSKSRPGKSNSGIRVTGPSRIRFAPRF